MSNLIRVQRVRPNELNAVDVIDLTADDDMDCEMEDITCDDLFPPAVDGESEYRVERILNCWQMNETSTHYYLVKWFGYPLSDATWENETALTNCQETVDAWHAGL